MITRNGNWMAATTEFIDQVLFNWRSPMFKVRSEREQC